MNGMNVCGRNSNCISETRAELESDNGTNHLNTSLMLANSTSLREVASNFRR